MSAQMIELVILGFVAFLVISKLISIIGSNTEESMNQPSYFGENNKKIKDVTNSVFDQDNEFNVLHGLSNQEINDIITENNKDNIIKGLTDIKLRLPNFNAIKMLKSSVIVFKMILDAVNNKKKESLNYFIDKRFIESFNEFAEDYGIVEEGHELKAKITEAYMFGNNAFVKILFLGQTSYISTLKEEWLFSKNVTVKSPEWYLTNIIKA